MKLTAIFPFFCIAKRSKLKKVIFEGGSCKRHELSATVASEIYSAKTKAHNCCRWQFQLRQPALVTRETTKQMRKFSHKLRRVQMLSAAGKKLKSICVQCCQRALAATQQKFQLKLNSFKFPNSFVHSACDCSNESS